MIKYIKNLFLKQDTKNAKRFQRITSILKKENIPFIEWLPVYPSSGLRSKAEICNRAICLMIVAVKGEGLEFDRALQIAKQYDVYDYFSTEEKEFLDKKIYDDQMRAKFTWRYESYLVLLWVLGYIDKLERPENICDVSKAVSIVHARTKEQFIRESRLRNLEEILDLAELTRRYHWAVRNDAINRRPPSTHIDRGIVYERHYAFDWILNKKTSWDEANTST